MKEESRLQLSEQDAWLPNAGGSICRLSKASRDVEVEGSVHILAHVHGALQSHLQGFAVKAF